ncbi:MAG: hypothetical protein AB8H86_29370 [Polyangiales bacterium]
MKHLILTLALFSLFGCGKSACEELADISVECGQPASSEAEIALCDALAGDNGLDACISCLDTAADPCTATNDGAECDAACTL